MALEKKWIVKEPGNPALVRQLVAELGVDPALANLLVQRNIKDFAQAKSFFRPQLEDLHDPYLMKDMDKAVKRLDRAIRESEKILVYGDYDVDGTTAVALVYSFLRKETPMVSYYIPDRYTEGYGISQLGIDTAADEGCTLIIALDCGIKANDKVEYARKKGIDFIICDHHLPAEELPLAVAVLDPKRNDCHYPYNELSGCGVGFKLMQAFCMSRNIPLTELYPFLDLVVVSIASDLVSITGENRILAHYGLKQLNESPRKGLLSIIKLAGLEKHQISVDD
ncbi:MAG TPA: DHH family phosphoesterase, partial [Bacteroidales bacterium]|nr:DHH family phosphoesterase [Bacteroidales bacterium]